jgi:hypothetical protein
MKMSDLIASQPITGNAVTPQTVAPPGLSGPLIYAGRGELKHLNGKQIADSIILMELDSGKNWLQAANLGARALIYIGRQDSPRIFFEEKFELSPLQFPRFWISRAKATCKFRKYLLLCHRNRPQTQGKTDNGGGVL